MTNTPDNKQELGETLLAFLRDINEQDETPESVDVDYILGLVSLYSDGYTKTSTVDKQINKEVNKVLDEVDGILWGLRDEGDFDHAWKFFNELKDRYAQDRTDKLRK